MAKDWNKQTGTIKWFDVTKRYGFILGKNNKDIFFHQSDISILEEHETDILQYLQPGASVRFTIIKDQRKNNKLKALHVTLYVIFLRPDGDSEIKDIGWCLDHRWTEICRGFWSGSWYEEKKHCYKIYVDEHEQHAPVPNNYICFKCQKQGHHWIMQCPLQLKTQYNYNKSDHAIENLNVWTDEDEDDESEIYCDEIEYGYNGIPQHMCDELLCQGIKPWDDDAMAALSVLYDFD